MEVNNFGYDDLDDDGEVIEYAPEVVEDEFGAGHLDIQDPMYKAAMFYQRLKLPIIPVCTADHRGMSLTHRSRCKSPGKSPLLPDWTSRGTPTIEEVNKWYFGGKPLNLGLILGATNHWNLVGVDVDGQLGEELIEQWSDGNLPLTWEFTTGQGRRLLYRLPEGFVSRKFKQGEAKIGELALLASGQQTILPPSVHHTGKRYTWLEGQSPSEIIPAMAPEWLLEKIKADSADGEINESPRVTTEDWSKQVGKGERNVQLTRLAGSLLAKRHMPVDDVFLFLCNWNQRHCDPPLPVDEIKTMVETIAKSEETKTKRLGKGKLARDVPIYPDLAAAFLKAQDKEEYEWRYIRKEDRFYYCHRPVGPWRSVSDTEVSKRIRDFLMEVKKEWAASRYISEIAKAMKEQLLNEDQDNLFDIGKHPDLKYVYCNNGMLDWKTGELTPWNWQSYSPIRLPVDWNPDAVGGEGYQAWDEAMKSWLPDDKTRAFLQEFVGYCLLPDCSFRTSVFLYGNGVNGKSLFLEVIKPLFGDWLESLPLQRINEKFDTASLQNKLVNICSDIDPKYMADTGNLKLLIAGEEVRGEHKFGASFSFTPVARLIFSANTLPRTVDRSEGWFSRWKIVTFPRKFSVNPEFKSYLLNLMKQPESLSGLLFWAIEGLQRLHTQHRFTMSDDMVKDSREYRNENDNVAGFLDNALQQVIHSDKTTVLCTGSLYSIYKEYCSVMGSKAVGQIEFSKRMQNLGIEKAVRPIKGKSTQCFIGVRINKDFEFGEDLTNHYNLMESMRVNKVL